MSAKTLKGASAPEQSPFSSDLLRRLAAVDPYAVEQLADFGGPSIFNPFIGNTAAASFDALESGLSFVHALIDSDEDLSEKRPGLSLFVQTLWSAVQYEAFRAKGGAA